VELKPEWRSLPSGILQDWPEGTPLTVATLASLMISLSDNTATDAMISLLGRRAVEKITPRNTPFLTTHDLFVLKAKPNGELREKWLAADVAARRALLDQIADKPLPRASDLEPSPTRKVEWFMAASELCALLEKTADIPAFAISPGPVSDEGWKATAYKGGSETGVLNLSARVVAGDGTAHCVTATWNGDHALDMEKLLAPWRGILQSLAGD
jgi:beta-lactamase class A